MEAKIVKTIWVTRLTTPPVIDAVQGDTARVAEFALADVIAPNGTIGTVYGRLRRNSPVSDDEYIVYNSATVTTTDGVTVVTVPLTSAMLASPGIWPMWIRLQDDDDIVTSFPFDLRVAKYDADAETIEGSNEFGALETALAALSQYDTRISGNADAIAAETTRATSAEQDLSDDIGDETTRAQAAEQTNAAAIAAEATRAQTAEQTNAAAIAALQARVQTGYVGTQITIGELSADYDVVFPTAFAWEPQVMLTPYTTTTNQANVAIPVLTAISATGFSFRVWRQYGTNASATAPSPAVRWLAVLI